jgi:anion-transporting  ArsA/GET3 family ATPase
MLNSLITSQTRVRLLVRLFMNSSSRAYLRGLGAEFGESTNGIRVELNRLEEASLLISEKAGNRKLYRANTAHQLYNDIHNIVLKETGITNAVEKILEATRSVRSIYLTGPLAMGIDSRSIDLVLVGSGLNRSSLAEKLKKFLKSSRREVKFTISDTAPEGEAMVLIWER